MFYQPNCAGYPARRYVPAAILVLMGVTLGVAPAPANATTVAGRTVGTFAVSPTGAATYTIPIWAPPGPQGMQPRIALTYNSQQGNGIVGVGWSISGLSSIYRCNLTYAQDAAPAAVALVTGDGYCMDGQRLRLTGGTYGTAGSTYQTEIANFVNVTAYGTAGSGPAYWIAQDRNGRTYTYGNGGSSQVLANGTSTAISWLLNEVSDPAGNTMTVSYSTTNTIASAVPSTISWTPSSHGSSSYNYTMTFGYGANVPQSSYYGYAAGTLVQNTNLLSSITIAYSGTTVKAYFLGYTTSPTTGRDELISVKECADSGQANCLLPTTITYQAGAKGVSTTGTSAPHGVGVLYDFNGDGYPDTLYVNGSTYYVAFGSSSGYGSGVNTGIPSTAAQVLLGDLNGGGEDGMLVANGGTWSYYSWNGSSFTSTSTGLAYDSTATQTMLADVNGDGLPDLVTTYFTAQGGGNYQEQINVRLNTGNGSSVSFGSATSAYTNLSSVLRAAQVASNSGNAGGLMQAYGTFRSFDFDGDGRDDLALQTITASSPTCGQPPSAPVGGSGAPAPPPPSGCTYTLRTIALISNGSTLTGHQITSSTGNNITPVGLVNFNSDACLDWVVGSVVYVAGCNGSTPGSVSLGAVAIGAMDWDGDGRTDILVANGSTVGVYLSTGNGVGSLQTTSIPYSSSNVYYTFSDPNGDGLDALGYSTSTGSTYYYAHNGAGTPPDLVSSITDGYGNSAAPTYVSLVQNNYTQYTDATYPYQNYIGPMYVLNEVVLSDPSSASGGTYNQTFWYYGAWTNLQGRGFEGFNVNRIVDSRTSLSRYQYFERAFPMTGMKYQDLVSNGTFYPTQTLNALPTQQQQSTLPWLQSNTAYQQRYFPYFSNSTTSKKEVGGTENGDLVTTTSTNYTFDNYGNPTQISTTVTDNDPGSPYNGQTWTTTTTNTPDVSTSPWCLGLLTESQVAYSSSLSGSNSVTRTKTFTPDTTNCRYTQIVTEPNSSQFKVTEALGYDSFGNINSDTVTGINMSARLTTANWGTTGQFPMSVTDPTSATTQFNYNFSYGLVSSVTDPNGLSTSWVYGDGFGRKTQENRPDSTHTNWVYENCANWGGCFLANNTLAVTYENYNSDWTSQSLGTTYYDQLERPLIANKSMLANGTYDRNEVRYDSLGRIVQRAAPCTWVGVTTPCTYWTTNTYDVLNRLTQSQRPISSTNSNLQTTTYAYAGRTITVTDPQSNARVTLTDVNGWLRQTKDPMGYSVTLAYDSAGSKTKVMDSLGNTLWSGTYNYGLAPYLASLTDMDMGSWGFTVDAVGEKTAWTDAKTQSFSETYDALSRPLTRTEPDLFTQWTWGTSATSHNIGKLQSVCTGTGASCSSSGYAESETYDSVGRRSQRTITLSGYSPFTYTWLYNANSGFLDTLTYPVSTNSYALQLKYGYQNGILQSVTDVSDTPNVTVWTANTMDPAGHVTEETLGNGIVTNRSFDAVTQSLGTAQSGVGGGAGVKNLAFLYDEMGNVTQRQDNNLGLTENIYYDNDYRFSYSKLNGTQNLSVNYDGTGNIISRSDVAGGATWTYDPSRKHQVTQAGSSRFQYSYDANGNAITRQGSTISWSSYNYPTTINAGSGGTAETVAFSYGPDRQRWQQMYTGNSTQETTNYIGGLLEVAASGGLTDYRHYINVAGEQVAVYSRKSSGTNTFSYLLSDHQASVASITSSSGTQVVGESFDAFGSRRNPTTWSGAPSNSDLTTIAGVTREGYTFQTALGLWMGMNHMNGRVEDSITGRFLSADPTIPDPIYSQSYNRYAYVVNNPLSSTDPSGFTPCGSKCKPTNGICATWIICDEPAGAFGTPQWAWQQFQQSVAAMDSADPIGGNDWEFSTLSSPSDPGQSNAAGDSIDTTPAISCTPEGNQIVCTVTVCAACKAPAPFQSPFANNVPDAFSHHPHGPQGNPRQLPELPPPQCEKGGGGGCTPQLTPPPTTCPNGGTPSSGNNSHVQSNIHNGALFGGSIGVVAGGLFVANLIGFPEVEVAEGGGAAVWGLIEGAHAVANGGLLGAGVFGSLGGAGGYLSTSPMCP
jgi:RHS repeat-associated protein